MESLFVIFVAVTILVDAFKKPTSYFGMDFLDRLYALYLFMAILLVVYDKPNWSTYLICAFIIILVINIRLRGIFFDK